jgi:hypothetical protein
MSFGRLELAILAVIALFAMALARIAINAPECEPHAPQYASSPGIGDAVKLQDCAIDASRPTRAFGSATMRTKRDDEQ